jgi:hypothetical protein
MGDQEEKERTERALKFYEALSGYFKLKPVETVILLHDIVNGLADTINGSEDLRRDLGYFAGQLKVLTQVLWINDHLSVIQKMVANPGTHENIIEAITRSAKAYYMLHSGEPIAIVDVAHLIESAASHLFKVIGDITNIANGCA